MDATSFWFNLVPAGSGRFRVSSAFYIHPLICFLCFTSLVSVTGSYTEDGPKTHMQTVQTVQTEYFIFLFLRLLLTHMFWFWSQISVVMHRPR